MSNSRLSRPCQQEAHNLIGNILSKNSKCLVKMFCGSGKSRIIVEIIISQNQELSVVVFPSLALISQFCKGYLSKEVCPNELVNHILLNVSSEIIPNVVSTTEPDKILQFINLPTKKIICVTYQSLETLLANIGDTKIGICQFDEAHRTTSSEYKKLIYDEPYKSIYNKQVFFTATPVNKNNITMFERECNAEGIYGDCGELAYEYTYLQGVNDSILKSFDVRIDMYTENATSSIYETIVRAILVTGNNMVLTFHADVSEDSKSDTSVKRFVENDLFHAALEKIIKNEFPDKEGKYKKITFRGLTGMDKDKNEVLTRFENTKDDEIFILASCATIGEGVDTKNANMCVFVDPKTSYTTIIQNIGRIVRMNGVSQTATVLIPVYIDVNKYTDCGDDKEKRDSVIREELMNGNYGGIANVCAALKEEDPELYDIMVRYPSNFTPVERENTIKSQNCCIDEDNMKQEYEVEEMIEEGKPIEIHTSNIDEPIIRHNVENIDDIITHLFQTEEENDDGEIDVVYYPIISKSGKNIGGGLKSPDKRQRSRLDFHCNDEIKMLWSIQGDCEIGDNMCSRIIECHVERIDNGELWKLKLNELIKNMGNNNMAPSQTSDNKETKKLGKWLSHQKTNYNIDITKCKHIMKNPEIHKIWTETLDKHSELLGDNKTIWKFINTKVVNYMTTKNKRPNKRDKNEEIKYMGTWILTQNGNYNIDITKCDGIMKNLEIHTLWTETRYKHSDLLCIDLISNWKKILDILIEYMSSHNNERPSKDSTIDDVKSLSIWILNNNKNYDKDISKCKECMKITEIHEKWAAVLDKHIKLSSDRGAKWKYKLAELIEYMKNNNNVTPSAKAKNKATKTLGEWFSKQKSNYNHDITKCEQSMKKPEIHKMWTDFMEMEKTCKKKNMKLAAPSQNPKPETSNERQIRVKSEISVLHQHYKTLRSDNLRNEFNTNPELWHKYHEISEQNEASFPEEEIPRNRIITELEKIQTKRTKNIVDMGCGKAQISQHFKDDSRFLFTNYDHIAFDESIVTACDISKTPEEDNSVEIAILSLAMWGSNCRSYITEAFRILETNGTLYIMEPTKRWSEMDGYNIKPETAASKLRSLLTDDGFIIVKENIGKFSMFVCIKHKFM